tara:strand:+ start:12811 stop:13464 length:654 start_codon:yes stop_codon:yes gene_type:complete
MSLTYAEMKTAIQDYTQNTEATFVTQLDRFIRSSEEKILKNVQLTFFKKNVTNLPLTASTPFWTIPTDLLAPYSFSFTNTAGDEVFLLMKDVDFIKEYNPDSTDEGEPVYYAPYDITQYILSPTPSASSSTEIHYFYRPASLTAGEDGGTTWLSINAENTLLAGALYEAYVFMKGEPDVLAMYEKSFTEGVMSMKSFGESKEIRDTYRTGMVVRDRT